jgi:hypothetical protein
LQQDRWLVADGPVRPILVVVSEPSLHPFGRIRKRQEPVGVQALTAEAAVERLDEGVVRRLAWPREVERDALGIGPQIEIAADELGALIDPNGLRIFLQRWPVRRMTLTQRSSGGVCANRLSERSGPWPCEGTRMWHRTMLLVDGAQFTN